MSTNDPIPPAPTPSWDFELLRPGCVHQTLYVSKCVFLVISSISALGLLTLVGRLLRHRWRAHRKREERWAALHQHQQQQQQEEEDGAGGGDLGRDTRRRKSQGIMAVPGFWRRWCVSLVSAGRAGPTARVTIGDLFERLVLTLCGWELVFYTIDFIYLLDCKSPAAIGITIEPTTVLHLKTLSTYLIKEALGMLILWLHGLIAYTLYAYTVQKISPARLIRNQRVWLLVVLVCSYMGLHAVLSLTIRDRLLGYYIGRMSYDALVIPISLVTISRWYWLVINELVRPTPTQQQQQQQQRQISESNAGGGPAPADGSVVTPRTPASSSTVSPLNRRLALRLLLILGTTTTIWALLFMVDVAAWAHHHRGNRDTSLLVMVTLRSALARSVGLCDAVILGVDAHFLGFFACCTRWCDPSRRRRSRGSSSNGRGTYSGDEEWGEGDEGGHRSKIGARTPTSGSLGGAEPASFLARPVMLRHRSNSANSLRSFSLPRSSASARQLFGLGGSSTSLVAGAHSQSLGHSQGAADSVAPEEEANAAVRAAEALRRARAPPLRSRQLRVFVTTWNMGGVELDAPAVAPMPGGSSGSGSTTERCADVLARLLPRWLPQGQDLYVVGVQECACLPRLRELLRGHLHGNGEGEAYTMFKTEIGDDTLMHGFIAMMLFVRTEDVASGAFRLHQAGVGGVATGVGLGPMGRAANKGTTGLSCRYHDATLAFLTSHFCSDKKGKNRLERRNRDAATALRELALVWDAGPDVDVQCLHRFSFLLGDLNYRNLASPAAILRRVARSARRMQAAEEGGNNWRAAAYARLLHAATHQQLQEEQEGGPDAEETEAAGGGGPYLPYTPPAPALVRVLKLQRRGTAAMGPRPTPMSRFGYFWQSSVGNGSGGGGSGNHVGGRSGGGGGGGGGGRLRRVLGSYVGGGSGLLARSRTERPSSNNSPLSAPEMGGRHALSTITGSSGVGSNRGGSNISAAAGDPLAGDPPGAQPPTPLSLRPTPAHSALSSYVSDDASSSSGAFFSFFPPTAATTATTPPPHPPPTALGPAPPSLPSVRLLPTASSAGLDDDEAATNVLLGSTGGGSYLAGDYDDDEDDLSDEEAEEDSGAVGGAWAWVERVDELTLSRRGRLALWGFWEKVIAFPPSYRFRRSRGAPSSTAGAGAAAAGDGLAGDFTSVERLARDAYTIHSSVVAATPAAPAGGPGRMRRSSTAISSVSSSGQPLEPPPPPPGGNGDGIGNAGSRDVVVEEGEEKEVEEGGGRDEEEGGGCAPSPAMLPPAPSPSTAAAAAAAAAACRHITRVPSYTDRVLAHAQPGYGDALHWLAYDMADCVELGSDHRPVCAAFFMEVDAAVRGFDFDESAGAGAAAAAEEDMVVFTLTLRAPAVEWWEAPAVGGEFVEEEEAVAAVAGLQLQQQTPPQPHEAAILFPLVSEDPLADARLASALGEALRGGLGGGKAKAKAGGDSHGAAEVTSSSQRHVRWDAFPLRFQAVASKRFSEHLVVKLSDDRGQDMGQAVVPIVLGLPPMQAPQAQASPPLPAVPRRLRFPLASAGVFKGWLTLELKVETSALER